ncbi:unnamed protein product, partial [Dovyalis caffra]
MNITEHMSKYSQLRQIQAVGIVTQTGAYFFLAAPFFLLLHLHVPVVDIRRLVLNSKHAFVHFGVDSTWT